jgi:hypothetical protein
MPGGMTQYGTEDDVLHVPLEQRRLTPQLGLADHDVHRQGRYAIRA